MTAERFRDAAFGEADATIPFRLRRDLSITMSTSSDGLKQYFVKILSTGEVFVFGEEELFITQSLREETTATEICRSFRQRFGLTLSESKLLSFIADLREMGLLVAVSPGGADRYGGGWSTGAPADAAARGPTWFEELARSDERVRRAGAAVEASLSPKRSFTSPFRIRLCNPDAVFSWLARWLRPLRFFTWLLIPATLLACLTLFHNIDTYVDDFTRSWGLVGVIPREIAAFLIVSIASALAQGAVAAGFGARINELGIAFVLGILPRVYIDTLPIHQLTRRGRLWSHAVPILVRLALFAVGTFLWISYRSTATGWSEFALLVSQTALVMFFIDSIPLMPNDGYFWVSEYLGRRMYLTDAFKLVGMRLTGRRPPEHLSGLQQWGLVFYVIGMILFLGLLIVPIMLGTALFLEASFSGTGVLIFLSIFGLFLLWLFVTARSLRRMRAGEPSENHRAIVPYRGGDLPARQTQTVPGFHRDFAALERQRQRSRLMPRLIWSAVFVTLAVVAFLPYPYESGGQFTVLPTVRVQVNTRAAGEVIKIHAKEGDWVQKGQLLAELSAWDKERDLAITAAQLDKSQAKLKILEDGPKAEEVEVARKQVESARARVTYSELEARRAGILVRESIISQQKAEFAETELAKNRADLAVAEANLQLVKSGATASEIEALRAEVRGLKEELAFRKDEVERTKIRAATDGRVITPNLHFNLGKYFPEGTLFAELEDSRVAQVEVDVPEQDMDEVQLGRTVRMKVWQGKNVERTGEVVEIAPIATQRNYGKVVRVKTEIPNEDNLLRSGMTGYAKIEGSDMPVWEAYTRLIMRFFRIEVWSWIP